MFQLLEYRNFLQHCSLFLIQQNYFLIYIQQNFKFLSKVVLSVYEYRTIWKYLKVNYLLLSFENRLIARNANFSRGSGRVGTRAGTRLQISDWLPTLLETQKIEECRVLSHNPQPPAERENRMRKSIYRVSQRKRTSVAFDSLSVA